MTFASLHTHSEHSELDSTAKISELFKRAAELGQTALAVTDHGTLSGLWKAQQAADANGVKLIPGIEAYLAIGDRFDRNAVDVIEDGRTKTKKYEHLTLLAESEAGWANLVAISNESQLSKWGKHARVDYPLIAENRAGLIILTGCLGGPILGPLSRGDDKQAEANLVEIIETVGRENVFIEIMEHGIALESVILPAAAALAAKYSIPLVATNDSHHTHADGAGAHDAWLAVSTKTTLTDPTRYQFHGTGYHLRSEAEMLELRPEAWWAEAVANTAIVADRIAARVLPRPNPKLPAFPTPTGFVSNLAYFKHLVREGAVARYGPLADRPDVTARLNEELHIIRDAGFTEYFLIVHEVVSWARSQGILVGPGRGSAAGSLTAYALGITGICPLDNDLLFERFLEPGRPDFPDIDVDFESLRRGDVLDHLEELWGSRSVSLIGSFSAAKTKRALQDAARVLDAGALGRTLSAVVPSDGGNPYSFDRLFDLADGSSAEFRTQYAAGGDIATKVVALAREFADTVNGSSIHACGVIVSDLDLRAIIPQRIDSTTGRWISAWDSKDVEGFGLLKLDVLSIRNLDVAAQAIRFIEETTGEHLDFDNLPHPDSVGNDRVTAAWNLLRDGRTAGIFQMESAKMTELARQVQPASLTDLSAVVALFRPGPLSAGMDQHFARRKNGQEQIDYGIFTDDTAEQAVIAQVLGATYGTFVFQEQLMHLGRDMAGFTVGQRGELRKAVGKKDKVKMAHVGEMFVAGAVVETRDPSGVVTSPAFSRATAERMWEQMKGSGSYLFNASHSAAYAQLAFITAFLKANWPAEYGAAILAVTDGDEKRIAALRALPEEGIEILAPDVNLSGVHSRPEGRTAVRLGLSEIKNVGTAGELIVAVRDAAGRPFASFNAVVDQVRKGGVQSAGSEDLGYLPSNQVEALIEAGALDEFGPRMGLFTIARVAKGAPELAVPAIEWGYLERSARQRAVLLVSIGEHPLRHVQQDVRAWRSIRTVGDLEFSAAAIPVTSIPDVDGTPVTTIGILSRMSEKAYKRGRLANVTIEGSSGSIDAVLWDETLSASKYAGVIPPIGGLIAVTGRVTIREFEQEDEEGKTTTTFSKELIVLQVRRVPVNDPIRGGLTLDGAARIEFAPTVARPELPSPQTGAEGVVESPGTPVVSASATPTATVTPAAAPTDSEGIPYDDVAPVDEFSDDVLVVPVSVPPVADAADDDTVARLLGIVPVVETVAVPVSMPVVAEFTTVTCAVNTPGSRICRGLDVPDEFRQRVVAPGGTRPAFNSHPSMVGTVFEVLATDRRTVIGEVRLAA